MESTKNITKGDWVSARDRDGHHIVGYVTAKGENGFGAKIKITLACCDRLVGLNRFIVLDDEHTMLLNDTDISEHEGFLRNAIDMALDSGDREWFMELTNHLQNLTDKSMARKIIAIIG